MNNMQDIDNIVNQHYAQAYRDRFETDYEEEPTICRGNGCDEKIDEEEYFCENCKKSLQRCWDDFKVQFTDEELEYLIDYIIN